MASKPKQPVYSWARRRRFMYLVSAFCAIVITFILVKDMQSEVAKTAITFSFLCLGGIVGSYVFGAAWQDITHINARRK